MTAKPQRKIRLSTSNPERARHAPAAPPLVPPAPLNALAPRNPGELAMHQFARRLNELMVQAGMNQSQLAASVFGTTTDTRGFTVARGRDRISNYLRGRDLPRNTNLSKIAKVFNMNVQELAPELIQSQLDRTAEQPISMRAVAGRLDRVHLVVNTVLPLGVASQIIALVTDAQEPQSK